MKASGRFPVVQVLAAAALACVFSAQAQDYPNRNVRTIVTVLPGGGSDMLARLVSARLSEVLGKPFIIEYRPGGDSAIGLNAIARAPADGYTFGIATSGLSINQALLVKKRPFDAIRDFAPVILLATTTTVFAGKAGLPADNIAQLIAYAKARDGKMTFASCSKGSMHHIAGELFAQMSGVRLLHVPFKGCTEGIPQVLNGEIDMLVNTLANVSNHVKAGRLKAYAITGSQRSQFAPDLPTMAESGLATYSMDNWFGMVAPAGTPPAIISRINAEANAALERKEAREKLVSMQYDVRGGTPGEFGALIKSEIERFSRLSIRLGDE